MMIRMEYDFVKKNVIYRSMIWLTESLWIRKKHCYNQFAGEKTHGFNHVDESPLFFILTVDIYLTYIYKCGTIYL